MLVLNATYEPINVCTVRRAVVLLLKDKAEQSTGGAFVNAIAYEADYVTAKKIST